MILQISAVACQADFDQSGLDPDRGERRLRIEGLATFWRVLESKPKGLKDRFLAGS